MLQTGAFVFFVLALYSHHPYLNEDVAEQHHAEDEERASLNHGPLDRDARLEQQRQDASVHFFFSFSFFLFSSSNTRCFFFFFFEYSIPDNS